MRIIVKTCLRAGEVVGLLIVSLSVAGCGSEAIAPDGPEQKNPIQIAPGLDSPDQNSATRENATRVMVSHSPLYSTRDHLSTITAVASNVASGLESIELVVVVGKMTDCSETGAQASAIPCRAAGSKEDTHVCPYSGSPKEETCSYPVSLTAGDLITYYARAIPSQGNPVQSGKITYSGGQPPESMAAPVLWHTGEPTGMPAISRISLGLFPDIDFESNFEKFAGDVSWIVSNAFFNDSQNFAKEYTEKQSFFDIWAIPIAGADAEGCQRDFSDDLLTIKAMMRGSAILHHGGFADCSNIKADGHGDGSVDVGKYNADWILVHESAHFLFGLADEYVVSGTPAAAVSDPANIFFTQPACEDTAKAHSWDPDECVDFSPNAVWRINDGNKETMEEVGYTSDFRNTSNIAINNRLKQCMNGNCY